MAITREVRFDDLTPDELAATFTDWDASKQADFFNRVWEIARAWPGAGWCQQSSYIATFLDDRGRDCIAKLAEWAVDPQGAPPSKEPRDGY